MSDKPKEKKAEETPDGKPAAKKAPIWTKLPVLLGGAMVLEAIVLLVVFKMMGGGGAAAAHADVEVAAGEPAAAEGAHGGGGGGHGGKGEGEAPKSLSKVAELEVTAFRAPNTQTGRRMIFDVSIFALVKIDQSEKIKTLLKERKATIDDRVRTIIAQSEPDKLGGGSEPGLETLRRQVKYQLEEIIGEGTIEEVLIPRCIPFRGD